MVNNQSSIIIIIVYFHKYIHSGAAESTIICYPFDTIVVSLPQTQSTSGKSKRLGFFLRPSFCGL